MFTLSAPGVIFNCTAGGGGGGGADVLGGEDIGFFCPDVISDKPISSIKTKTIFKYFMLNIFYFSKYKIFI